MYQFSFEQEINELYISARINPQMVANGINSELRLVQRPRRRFTRIIHEVLHKTTKWRTT